MRVYRHGIRKSKLLKEELAWAIDKWHSVII